MNKHRCEEGEAAGYLQVAEQEVGGMDGVSASCRVSAETQPKQIFSADGDRMFQDVFLSRDVTTDLFTEIIDGAWGLSLLTVGSLRSYTRGRLLLF